jgi:hypothetical protein
LCMHIWHDGRHRFERLSVYGLFYWLSSGWFSTQPEMIPASASSPSVSAAGPGCRMSVDLTSRSQPVATAGTSAKPGRAATLAGTNFLPHQEPMMMSGAAGDHVRLATRCGPWRSCAPPVAGTPRCRRRPRSVPTPSRGRKSSARPIPRNRSAAGAAASSRARAPR